MRKLSFFIVLMLFAGFQAMAQMQVTGKVTNAETGDPIPGVSIVVKSEVTIGTSTDMDGNYTLRNIPSDAKQLVYSFVGMQRKVVSIKGRTNIDVALTPSVQEMEEVVVTAIGVKRETKKLGYAVSNVSADEVTQTQTNDAISSLQGKVAGVQITSSSGAPTASNNVVIRGYSSVTGNNQPLYVVDGTPINNANNAAANNLNNQIDFGNGATAIDPSTIESINILKGAAATALYGSRAANGVVMITTKSGDTGQDITVDFSSSSTFSEPLRVPQQQTVFGQGWSGNWNSAENGSWGPEMDGEVRLWGNTVDNSRLLKPFSPQEDNLRDFFTIGKNFKNNLTVRGGNENSTFFASYGNTMADAFIPTDADSYDRHAINLKGSTSGEHFKLSASLNYIKRMASAVAAGQGGDGATLMQDIMQVPKDLSIIDMSDYKNKFYNLNNFYTPYATNPYFIINENGNELDEDRIFGNINLNYQLTDDLDINWRVGQDVRNSNTKIWNAIARIPDGAPNASKQDIPGNTIERATNRRETNSDLTLNYTKQFEKFDFDLLGGWNVNERYMKRKTAQVNSLEIPKYYNLANSSQNPVANTYKSRRRLYGVYGQASIGFNNYLFVNLTARNDWSSTLPDDNNSFFYPGATVGFIVSDAVPAVKSFADYFKVRASWGKTGNDAPPYAINSVVVPAYAGFAFGGIDFPISGVNAYEVSNQIGNKNLQPEITTEFEVGFNAKFFENRLGLDLAYYSRSTTDQIFSVPLASTSGYTSQYMNFGEVTNKGIEALVNLKPIRTDNFTWDINYTFTQNRNEVVELPEGQEQVIINGAYDMNYVAMEGHPLGIYVGPVAKKDPQGRTIVNNDGIPLPSEENQIWGDQERDFTMGLNNTFTYKNLRLGASLDWRKGGMFYAYTARINYFVGNATNSLYNHRQPFVVPNSVKAIDENEDGETDRYVENTTQIDRANIGSYWNASDNPSKTQSHVLDKSFIKLRDVTLTYNLPKELIDKMGLPLKKLSVGAYGRNLIIWTPEENNFVDPEISTFGNDAYASMGEFGGIPTARSYGLKLNVTF